MSWICRIELLVVAGITILGTGCVVPGSIRDERPCPCPTGWYCQDEVCVQGAIPDLGAPDGGPRDLGSEEGDGGPNDLGTDAMDAFEPGDMGPRGPVAEYACEEVGFGVIEDETGNGNDARCGLCPTIVPGRIGMACEFDAAAFLRVAYADDLDPSDGFSVSFWFRVEAAGDYSLVAMPVGTSTLNAWQVYIDRGEPRVTFGHEESGGTMRELHGPLVPEGAWTHVAATYDGTRKRLYVDGIEYGPADAEILGDGRDLFIGADQNDGATIRGELDGWLDEVVYYDHALDTAAVRALAEVP